MNNSGRRSRSIALGAAAGLLASGAIAPAANATKSVVDPSVTCPPFTWGHSTIDVAKRERPEEAPQMERGAIAKLLSGLSVEATGNIFGDVKLTPQSPGSKNFSMTVYELPSTGATKGQKLGTNTGIGEFNIGDPSGNWYCAELIGQTSEYNPTMHKFQQMWFKAYTRPLKIEMYADPQATSLKLVKLPKLRGTTYVRSSDDPGQKLTKDNKWVGKLNLPLDTILINGFGYDVWKEGLANVKRIAYTPWSPGLETAEGFHVKTAELDADGLAATMLDTSLLTADPASTPKKESVLEI